MTALHLQRPSTAVLPSSDRSLNALGPPQPWLCSQPAPRAKRGHSVPPSLPREHTTGRDGFVRPCARDQRGASANTPYRLKHTWTRRSSLPLLAPESRDRERKLTMWSTRTSSKTSSPIGCCKQSSGGNREQRQKLESQHFQTHSDFYRINCSRQFLQYKCECKIHKRFRTPGRLQVQQPGSAFLRACSPAWACLTSACSPELCPRWAGARQLRAPVGPRAMCYTAHAASWALLMR